MHIASVHEHKEMRRRPMIRTALSRARQLALPLLVVPLLLAGCSTGPGAPGGGSPSGEPTASGTPKAQMVVGPKECVVGSWKVDNATFENFVNTSTGIGSGIPAGVDTTIRVSGNSYLRFDDKGAYFGWRDDFTLAFGSGKNAAAHVSNSGETGDYGVVLDFGKTVKNDFLWVAETMEVMRDEVFTVGGLTQVVDSGGETVRVTLFEGYNGEVPRVGERESVEGTGPFWCDGDVLKFGLDGGTEMLYRRTTVTKD